MMILTYDQVMTVLADTTPEEIERLMATPLELEAMLISQTSLKEVSLEPDTQIAYEAAVADGMKYDRAEETIYRLLEQNPSAWETFKATVRRLSPESAIASHLERYSLTDLLLAVP